MGVRLYDPATGRFLSMDPVPGGSANAYEYCGDDPLNRYDLDGRWCKPRFSAGARLLWRYANRGYGKYVRWEEPPASAGHRSRPRLRRQPLPGLPMPAPLRYARLNRRLRPPRPRRNHTRHDLLHLEQPDAGAGRVRHIQHVRPGGIPPGRHCIRIDGTRISVKAPTCPTDKVGTVEVYDSDSESCSGGHTTRRPLRGNEAR